MGSGGTFPVGVLEIAASQPVEAGVAVLPTRRERATGTVSAPATAPCVFVVPAYNEEENILRLLDDFAARPDLFTPGSRVIVVDDGSVDSTAELVAGYQRACRGSTRVARTESGARRRLSGGFRGSARRLSRRRADRHARGRHDERPGRAARDAPAGRRGSRPRPGLLEDDRRQPQAQASQRGGRLCRSPDARARGHHGVVVLPRVPQLGAARRLGALRRPPHRGTRLCLQGRVARQAHRDARLASPRSPSHSTGAAVRERARCPSPARCSPTGA